MTSLSLYPPPFLTVAQAGTKSDLATDDAPLINAFIAASPAGSTIWFPGNHLVGSTIILLSGRNYLGPTGHCDAGPTFYQKNGANLPAVVASSDWYNNATSTGSSLAIRNIVVDANQAHNTTSHGIVLMNEFSSIEDCVVRNAPGSGILLTATNRGGTNSSTTNVNNRVINCYVTSCSGHGIWIHDNALNAVTDGYIRDCIVDTATLDSIYLENAAGWFLSGNHVYGCQANGYNLANCYSTFVIGNEVDGYGFGIGSGGYVYGMVLSLITGRATIIEGNIISNSSENSGANYFGLSVGATNTSATRAHVSNNHVLGAWPSSATQSIGFNYSGQSGGTYYVREINCRAEGISYERVFDAHTTFDGLELNNAPVMQWGAPMYWCSDNGVTVVAEVNTDGAGSIQTLGNISTGQSATTPDPGAGGTITTATIGVARVTPAANRTGVILQDGTVAGQKCSVVNNSGSFTIQFAASGTSHVAQGTGLTIAVNGKYDFTWDSVAGLWY